MRQTISTILSVLLLTTLVYAQKKKTMLGDMWTGVVESVDEATREIKIVNPDKKTETFTGVLEDGYQVKLKDGTSRELKMSELKPGLRVRVLYKSKTRDVAGQRTKVKLINRLHFLGRDEYTRLREILKLQPSIPAAAAKSTNLPAKDPLKLYLGFEPQNLDKGFVKWVDQWNKEQSAKYGRVEIVDDLAQSDASVVVIWGADDSFMNPMALVLSIDDDDRRKIGFGTAYLTITENTGLHVLWQSWIAIVGEKPQFTAPGLGKQIEKRLKARTK